MYTLKLRRGHTTTLIECNEVRIYPAGPKEGPVTEKATTDVMEISAFVGDTNKVFYVMDPEGKEMRVPDKFSHTLEFYEVCYIENDKGNTTEIVRAY